jgi:hypothetical protein
MGELFAFLDADDLWEKEKLAQQVDLLERCPEVGVCFTNYRSFGAPTSYQTGFEEANGAIAKYPRWQVGPDMYVLTSGSQLEDFLRYGALPKPSTVVVRRQAVEKMGMFDETLTFCQDTQMWFRLAKYFRFAYVDRPLVWRRIRGDSLASSQDDRRYIAEHIHMFETLDRWVGLSRTEGREARRLLAHYRFAAGYSDFAAYRLTSARYNLWRSMRADCRARALWYLSLSFVPRPALLALRHLKHRVHAARAGQSTSR